MKYCKIVAGDEFLYIKFKMQNGKKGKGLATPEQAKKMIFDLEAALSQPKQPHQKGKTPNYQEVSIALERLEEDNKELRKRVTELECLGTTSPLLVK